MPAYSGPPSATDVLAQLDRILAHRLFVNSERLSAFLRYAVETTLSGQAESIKEVIIGTEIFRRGPDFDPQTDNLVRVSANRLRGKLAEYYHRAGHGDPVIIDIPKGRYAASFASAAPKPPKAIPASSVNRTSVGRERERSRIEEGFTAACSGRATILAISGDPGLGKTTIAEEFLSDLEASGVPAWIARGCCPERSSSADALAPVFECLEGLTRGESRAEAAQCLKEAAPTWFALAAPGGLAPKELSQERMRREFVRLFETLSAIRPLVVFLDDLHWADASTCGLLAYLGSRMNDLRVLILVTYRPLELLPQHPFLPVRLSFGRSGVYGEIRLKGLTLADIESYLALRFSGNRFSPDFARVVLERTEGSPLFLSDMMSFLLDKRVLVEEDRHWRVAQDNAEIRKAIPTGSESMIRLQLGRLSPLDRKILQCAAVQGVEFDSEAICRALSLGAVDVEERLQEIEQVYGFVRSMGERKFPGQVFSVRYRFAHVYYQNALHAELAPTRRASYSLALAEALVILNEDTGRSLPAEVAALFESGRDYRRASEYFLRAARYAAGVFAYPEAVILCERGLAILPSVAESQERDARELKLSLILGLAQMATCGFAAPEVERTHRRSRELCLRLNEKRLLVRVLWGIHTCVINAAEFAQALELAEEMRTVATELDDPVSIVESLHALGTTHAFMGNLEQSREMLERIFAVLPPGQHRFVPSVYVMDTHVTSLSMLARVLVRMGLPEQSMERARASVALAETLAYPPSLTYATFWVGWICHARGEYIEACAHLDVAMTLARKHALPQIVEWGRVVRGSCLAHTGRVEEGIAEIRTSLDNQLAMRCLLERPYCLTLLAEALVLAGDFREAMSLCDEALLIANATQGRSYEQQTRDLRDRMVHMVQGEGVVKG